MHIIVKKIHPEAKIPTYALEGDAGMDLYSVEDIDIIPFGRVSCRTGIAVKIPNGYVGLIWDKSGLSHISGLKTLGGVMDSNYRGEYKIGLLNTDREVYHVKKGQKIAQLLIQRVEKPDIEVAEELDGSARGEGGFGSTGEY